MMILVSLFDTSPCARHMPRDCIRRWSAPRMLVHASVKHHVKAADFLPQRNRGIFRFGFRLTPRAGLRSMSTFHRKP